MIQLLEFIISTIGLTFIITQFYIFKNIREFINNKSKLFGKLFSCTACMGFWCGLFVKTMLLLYYNTLYSNSIFIILIYGFIGSIVSYTFYLIIKPLIDKYD
jgi:hypothetical protein